MTSSTTPLYRAIWGGGRGTGGGSVSQTLCPCTVTLQLDLHSMRYTTCTKIMETFTLNPWSTTHTSYQISSPLHRIWYTTRSEKFLPVQQTTRQTGIWATWDNIHRCTSGTLHVGGQYPIASFPDSPTSEQKLRATKKLGQWPGNEAMYCIST